MWIRLAYPTIVTSCLRALVSLCGSPVGDTPDIVGNHPVLKGLNPRRPRGVMLLPTPNSAAKPSAQHRFPICNFSLTRQCESGYTLSTFDPYWLISDGSF